MANVIGTLVGSKDFFNDFKIRANVVAGQVMVREVTEATAAEVDNPTSATAAPHIMGIASEAVTFTAAPSNTTPESIVRILINPFNIVRFVASGGTTSDTALVADGTAPSNILVNTAASTANTTVSDTDVGTVDFSGGLMKGRTGANMGQTRKISAHTNNVSESVTAAFLNDIAVDESFIRVPWSKMGVNMQTTADFTQAHAVIDPGTGIAVVVHNVVINEVDDSAVVDVVFRDHHYNPST